ncbi:progestin and adipoQ receptor family member 3-like isoform X2 [Clavelina lepadiformis]|uniref:progestin and adipoQ receptor family member 3-like isoform X2 n=1 Tax=Clavelina lepadiformis TaxID=159417 RepID=UPI0040425CD3
MFSAEIAILDISASFTLYNPKQKQKHGTERRHSRDNDNRPTTMIGVKDQLAAYTKYCEAIHCWVSRMKEHLVQMSYYLFDFSDIPLYSFDEVPDHQQGNSYVIRGYRAKLLDRQCMKSALRLSNQLVNIWTHGGLFILLIPLMIHDLFCLLPSMGASPWDNFSFLIYHVCTQSCFVASAGYHTFNCHLREAVAARWLACDCIGVVTGVTGIYVVTIYQAFACNKISRICYLTAVVALVLASRRTMLHPGYFSKLWEKYRILHFSTFVALGCLIAVHWCIISTSEELETFLPEVVINFVIIALALLILVTKVPERFSPGEDKVLCAVQETLPSLKWNVEMIFFQRSFDYFGQSHNWWHILVGVAFLRWRQFAINYLNYRLNTSCVSSQEPW